MSRGPNEADGISYIKDVSDSRRVVVIRQRC